MDTKKATNSQPSTTESKKKQTKQTTRTGTQSTIWRPFGGLSAGKGKGDKGKEVQGLRSTNW